MRPGQSDLPRDKRLEVKPAGPLAHLVHAFTVVTFIAVFLGIAMGFGGDFRGVYWTYGSMFLLVVIGIWWEAARWRRGVRERVRRRRDLGLGATAPRPVRRGLRFPPLRRARQRKRIERRAPSMGMIWAGLGLVTMLVVMLIVCAQMVMKTVG